MIIFEWKYLNHEWNIGEVPGTIYEMNENGWTDQVIHVLAEAFLSHAVPA